MSLPRSCVSDKTVISFPSAKFWRLWKIYNLNSIQFLFAKLSYQRQQGASVGRTPRTEQFYTANRFSIKKGLRNISKPTKHTACKYYSRNISSSAYASTTCFLSGYLFSARSSCVSFCTCFYASLMLQYVQYESYTLVSV